MYRTASYREENHKQTLNHFMDLGQLNCLNFLQITIVSTNLDSNTSYPSNLSLSLGDEVHSFPAIDSELDGKSFKFAVNDFYVHSDIRIELSENSITGHNTTLAGATYSLERRFVKQLIEGGQEKQVVIVGPRIHSTVTLFIDGIFVGDVWHKKDELIRQRRAYYESLARRVNELRALPIAKDPTPPPSPIQPPTKRDPSPIKENTTKSKKAKVTGKEKVKVIIRPYLGIEIKMLDDDQGNKDCLAVIHSTSADGPAQQAGFKEDDVLMKWDGNVINSKAKWEEFISSSTVGSVIHFDIVRNGEPKNISLTVGSTQKIIGGKRKVKSKTKASTNTKTKGSSKGKNSTKKKKAKKSNTKKKKSKK